MSPMVKRLSNFINLQPAEVDAVEAACARIFTVQAGQPIPHDPINAGSIKIIVSGMACRCKYLPNGRRQIISCMVPGDLCDTRIRTSRNGDQILQALSRVEYAAIPAPAFLRLCNDHPRIRDAVRWLAYIEEATLREWLVSLGQRTAIERLAHLLCELYLRLEAVKLVENNVCDLPLTQLELADALGLSPVHINRTLQDLRAMQFIKLAAGRLTMMDFTSLSNLAMFDPTYLHLPLSERAENAQPSAQWERSPRADLH